MRHARRTTPPARAATAVLLLGLGVSLLTGCSGEAPRVSEENVIQPGRPGEEAEVLPPGSTLPPSTDTYTEADVAFLVQMVPHHEQALEMAGLAPDRASDERVLGLASRIADVQQAEIDVYVRWLADHGLGPDGRPEDRAGADHGPEHDVSSMPGMASDEDLAALAAADGTEFDRLWLTLMIAHHEGALEMAAQRDAEGLDARVGELAADVAVTQLDEIGTMEAVLADL